MLLVLQRMFGSCSGLRLVWLAGRDVRGRKTLTQPEPEFNLVWPSPKSNHSPARPDFSRCVKDSDVTCGIDITAVHCWCWASSITEYWLPDSTVALSTCSTRCHWQPRDSENSAFEAFTSYADDRMKCRHAFFICCGPPEPCLSRSTARGPVQCSF